MNCAVCAKECALTVHQRYEGVAPRSVDPGQPWKPARFWTIVAPLYFKATADGAGCERPFCSAGCASAYAMIEAALGG